LLLHGGLVGLALGCGQDDALAIQGLTNDTHLVGHAVPDKIIACAVRNKVLDIDSTRVLADAMHTVLCLHQHSWCPVELGEDNGVRGRQGEAGARGGD
jgi:hypothetical protein